MLMPDRAYNALVRARCVQTGCRTPRTSSGRAQASWTSWQRVSSEIEIGRPGLSASRSDSATGAFSQRARHLRTTRSETPSNRPISVGPSPSASIRTIRERCTRACGARCRRTVRSSARRAPALRRTRRAGGPGCTPHQSISPQIYFHSVAFNSTLHPGTEIWAVVLGSTRMQAAGSCSK